jgi:hypothetical protein
MTPTEPTREILTSQARTLVRTLRTDYITSVPLNYSFSLHETDGEAAWESMEAVVCEDCGRWIVDGDDHGYVDADGNPAGADFDPDDDPENHPGSFSSCPRTGDSFRDFREAEGPMMNYLYPISEDAFTSTHAHLIADLPLCLVQSADGVFLALTGGGMDLSWEICEGYILLGYLPPSHFWLPAMADKILDERTARIVAAVARSNEVLNGWANRRRAETERFFTDLPLTRD